MTDWKQNLDSIDRQIFHLYKFSRNCSLACYQLGSYQFSLTAVLSEDLPGPILKQIQVIEQILANPSKSLLEEAGWIPSRESLQ